MYVVWSNRPNLNIFIYTFSKIWLNINKSKKQESQTIMQMVIYYKIYLKHTNKKNQCKKIFKIFFKRDTYRQ